MYMSSFLLSFWHVSHDRHVTQTHKPVVPCCICRGIAGVWVMADFGSHMLVVFISNFAFYMIYYIIVKVGTHMHAHTH